MFWKCSPTANSFECPVWRITGSVSGAFFLRDHQYKCVLEKYKVRLACARINTIQETAWNKASAKTKKILLAHEAARKWNAMDESEVQTRELHWKQKVSSQTFGTGKELVAFTIYCRIFMYLTQTKVQKNISTEAKPHLWNIYKRLCNRILHAVLLSFHQFLWCVSKTASSYSFQTVHNLRKKIRVWFGERFNSIRRLQSLVRFSCWL